jgi:hypothetical protein
MTDTIVERLKAVIGPILDEHGRAACLGERPFDLTDRLARAAIAEYRNAMSEGVGELVERMRAQLHVWEDEEPTEDWWTYQREYGEAMLRIEALQARLAEVTGERDWLREIVFYTDPDEVPVKYRATILRIANGLDDRAALSPSEEQG